MGKVIPILPELSEEQAKKILDNVSNAVCQPFPKAQAIVQEIEYIAYKFNRKTMSYEDLLTIGFKNCEYFELAYQRELLGGFEGACDE